MAAPESASAPFEGPEKLLEIWFAPSPSHLPAPAAIPRDGKIGLRKISTQSWHDILAIVQCKVLSSVQGIDMDAYLLSESSLFVSPHRIILKTCGTTLNLLGLPRILQVAREEASLNVVHRLFYSRKSFMFPDRQQGLHRDWRNEVQYLDTFFSTGAAYTVGRMNGDHWLLYMTNPGFHYDSTSSSSSSSLVTAHIPPPMPRISCTTSGDYTIEILMTQLSNNARYPFMSTSSPGQYDPAASARSLSKSVGIADIFPPHITTLDAYSFSPCGYSSNALLTWKDPGGHPESVNEGYYTIHVTPEEGCSYASFECNVPIPTIPAAQSSDIPDLETLVRRVVRVFQPGRLSLTLFISSEDNPVDDEGESEVEKAQRAFRRALTRSHASAHSGHDCDQELIYKRKDKINYEFGDYDLAFATFELSS